MKNSIKTVLDLMRAVEHGENPMDAVRQREINILLEENIENVTAAMEFATLSTHFRSDLQVFLLRYQSLFQKQTPKLKKGETPEHIVDFSFSVTVKGFIIVDYYDDRINANVEMRIDNKDVFAWIKDKGYNVLLTQPSGPDQEPEEKIENNMGEFIGIYLERWHVLEYLTERGIF